VTSLLYGKSFRRPGYRGGHNYHDSIPGKTAPVLITQEMVESMKSIWLQSRAAMPLTKPGEIYTYQVTIVGLTAQPHGQASQLYGTNLCHLLNDMGGARLQG